MNSKKIDLPEVETKPKVIAVKLSIAGEQSVRNNHPWLFSDSIIKIPDNALSGDIAVIFSFKKNKPIGVGLYDAHSPIAIKMVHFGGGAQLNEAFFLDKIQRAYAIRLPLLETKTNSYRLLFGENDGFPGLIADVYADVLVVKMYSTLWIPYIKAIVQQLIEVTGSKTAVLRLSRNVTKVAPQFVDGSVIFGTLPNEEVPFIEHGIHFAANVIKGHKTGYFLDHRHNRRNVGLLANNKSVLDVFSYAGGFSVHALVGGATSVTSLDISKQALDVAVTNAKRNNFNGTHNIIAGDAFEALQQLIQQQQRFDIVVIDPPSFAKSKSEINIAKKKYQQLTQLGEKLTARGGLLVLASCSSRVTADAFFQLTKETLQQQPRTFTTEKKTTHDMDHPIAFPEGAYLKCVYYRFL